MAVDWICRTADSLLERVASSPSFKTWRFCCGITLLLFLKYINISIEVKSSIPCYKRLLQLLQPSIGVLSEQGTFKRSYYSEEVDMLLGDTFNDRFVYYCIFMLLGTYRL